MTRARRAIMAAACTLLSTCASSAFSLQDRSTEILARAREAIGGEARLRAVHSLRLEGTALRQTASRARSFADGTIVPLNPVEERYPVEIEILLPDKFVVRRRLGEIEDGFNGTALIARARGVPRRVSGPNAVEMFVASRQRQFLRYLLAWILVAPGQYGVRFTDGGIAAIDGAQADVVDANAPSGLAVRLLFDKECRLLAVQDRQPGAVRSASPEAALPTPGDAPLFFSLESAQGQEPRGVQIRVADYRMEDGISLPHRIITDSNRYDHEEWRVTRVQVNGTINPKHFNAK